MRYLFTLLCVCALGVMGCSDGESACVPGSEGCACNEGRCLSGLECLSDLCVGAGGTGGSAGTGGTGGTAVQCDDGTQAADDSVECEACILCSRGGPCQQCNVQSCQAFLGCALNCTTDACIDNCASSHPAGADLFLQATQCAVCDTCPNNCGFPPSLVCGGTGGTGGTGGSGGGSGSGGEDGSGGTSGMGGSAGSTGSGGVGGASGCGGAQDQDAITSINGKAPACDAGTVYFSAESCADAANTFYHVTLANADGVTQVYTWVGPQSAECNLNSNRTDITATCREIAGNPRTVGSNATVFNLTLQELVDTGAVDCTAPEGQHYEIYSFRQADPGSTDVPATDYGVAPFKVGVDSPE